jgi:very-short-patch-repair endonuclease
LKCLKVCGRSRQDKTPMTETSPGSSDRPFSGPSEAEQIQARLNLVRERLVDKNLRNRLISANLTSSRTKSVRIFNGDSAYLFDQFVVKNRGMGFELLDEAPPADDDSDVPESAQQVGEGVLKTRLAKEALQKKLKALYFEARDYEEEQGVNILYLALGFIRWFESDTSEVERYAPIVLLPVELVRDGARDKYRLVPREEDLFENVSFKLWVKEQNNIDLPELPEGDEWSLPDYVDSVAAAISKESRWNVLVDDAMLGFFSFNKFLLWRDLFPSNWPSPAQILEHPIVKDLLMPPKEATEPDQPLIAPDEKIDDFFSPSDLVYVVDADSSQTEAIQTVLSGRNVVIQGPPGTGKSQTITNIISGAVNKGWKVLFIAEKRAALEVVERRLSKAGLGVMCLQLHSRKSTKSAVLDQIRQAVDYQGAPQSAKTSVASLARSQEFLNSHSARINTSRSPWGFTPFEIIGEIERAQRLGNAIPGLEIPNSLEYTKSSLSALSDELQQLSNRLKRSGVPSRHPWRNSRAVIATPMELEVLRGALIALADARSQMNEAIQGLATDCCLPKEGLESLSKNDWLDFFKRQKSIALPSAIPVSVSDSLVLSDGLTSLKNLHDALTTYNRTRDEVDEYLMSGWNIDDIRSLRKRIAGLGGSLFSIFNAEYRRAISEYKGLTKRGLPKGFSNRVSLLDKALSLEESKTEICQFPPQLQASLGSLWEAEKTDLDVLQSLITWFALWPSENEHARQLLRALGRDETLRGRFQNVEDVISNFYGCFKQVCLQASIDESGFEALPYAEVACEAIAWRDAYERFNEWPIVRSAIERLRKPFGDTLHEMIWNGNIEADHIEFIFRYGVLASIWRQIVLAEPSLAEIDALRLDTELKRFRELDLRRLNDSSQEVLAAYSARLPTGSGGEMAVVRQELVKKRNVFPVRKLLGKAGRAIQELKPVFLMSPLSVAQFVSPGNLMFDLILIDEASQVRPEDAIGAIARGRQVVVVGDSKQLPPTNFFAKLVDEQESSELLDDDGGYVLNDVESILALCDGVFKNNTMLRWHYRSLHPGLIAVSNRNFYDGRLLLPPSVLRDRYSQGMGVSFVKSPPNGYIRGGSEGGRNIVEAELIAREIIEFARRSPDKSLGVAAFSVTQRDAIRDLVDEHRRKSPDTEAFFSASRPEPFFVKNLESIQGDERDVIFISVGYGRTSDGRLTQTFGPLAAEGGERRLNVLISRAKERCTVFSSITSEDVKPSPGKLGVNAFREFLQFAEKGYFDVPEVTNKGFDSDFEESVAMFLVTNGYKVQAQVGMSGFYIDIGVIHPSDEGRFLCGIECDGATYHSSRSARDRDRLRQQILEGRGWSIYRIWSTDWFHRRPQQEAKLLDHLAALASGASPPEIEGVEVSPDEDVSDSPSTLESPHTKVQDDEIRSSYVEFAESFSIASPLHELPLSRLIGMVDEVVSVEGPIHQDEVGRRLARACGLEKAGSRIQAATQRALKGSRVLTSEGGFWALSDPPTLRVRNRANVSSRTLLLPENLPPAEIRLALHSVVKESVRIEESEAIQAAARLFGFQRVGPDIRRIFSACVGNSHDLLARDADGYLSSQR